MKLKIHLKWLIIISSEQIFRYLKTKFRVRDPKRLEKIHSIRKEDKLKTR